MYQWIDLDRDSLYPFIMCKWIQVAIYVREIIVYAITISSYVAASRRPVFDMNSTNHSYEEVASTLCFGGIRYCALMSYVPNVVRIHRWFVFPKFYLLLWLEQWRLKFSYQKKTVEAKFQWHTSRFQAPMKIFHDFSLQKRALSMRYNHHLETLYRV